MPFDFSIEYKKGFENKVVDDLSRMTNVELLSITLLTFSDE